MNFKKWVKSIQTAGYNGARTVCIISISLDGPANLNGSVVSRIHRPPALFMPYSNWDVQPPSMYIVQPNKSLMSISKSEL